ncbi:MAG: hypothetical protein FWD87_01855 [Spirochaetaceae bacterium]|nr:hypothetical protein [Spirochaetaceae bacterium]
MLNRLLVLIFFLFSALALSAQTAAELDRLLETEAVTAAGAARFVLGAAELLPPGLSGAAAENAAYNMARTNRWITKEAADPINLRDAAFLVMNAFEIRGGIMYSFTRAPRYAYREMVYRRLIQGRAYPSMKVSGEQLLQIIGSALSHTGENELMDALLQNTGGIR